MIFWRRGKIVDVLGTWGKTGEYQVLLEDGNKARALAYFPLVGQPQLQEEVLLSSAAVVRGLGTGGYLFIVAIPARIPADTPTTPGHIVKARYTPLQYMVQGIDEQESPYYEELKDADSIMGMPVIAADLHSALPAIVLGIKEKQPAARIAYIMSDGGALPVWFSQILWQLQNKGDIIGTISCGQAFGGDLEAVNIYSALLAAHLVWKADFTIVTQGPGNLGTGTRWGFSGTQIGEALNAAGILAGIPISVLRMSSGDKRERHRGISHHSMQVLQRIVTTPCRVPIPAPADLSAGNSEFRLPADIEKKLKKQIHELEKYPQLQVAAVSTVGLGELLSSSPYPLRTMGRDFTADPLSFLAAAAAGRYAAELYR